MMRTKKVLFFLLPALACFTSQAREYEGARDNSIVLNGQWEFARGDGSEHAESPVGQRRIAWQKVTLPGPFMKWVLALPDLAGSRVKIRVTPTGTVRLNDLTIDAQVRPWPDGPVLGEGQASAKLVPNPDPLGGDHYFVEVPMPGFEPWTDEECSLYIARVKLAKDGRILDELTFRFGMREIGVKNRNYQLNGKNLWLRGSNLVFDWNWGGIIDRKEREYLITEAAGDRTLTASEYMNDFGHPRTQWTGVDDRRANDLAVAQIGAEHTEAMRRARLDCILPYMYAGWTRTRLAARVRETGEGSAVWKGNYAAPQSAAWHSSLSPVLTSLDLFDPNYRTGQRVTTDLFLINDSRHEAKIHVDLLLTKECPEYIPEAKCLDDPVSKSSFAFRLPADSIDSVPITWKLPDEEGCYWLTARTTGVAGRPVLSQRFVRAIAPSLVPNSLRQRRFVILGGDDTARAFFRSKGLRITDRVDELSPDTHAVVIWNASHLTPEEKRTANALCTFAGRGGRVVVLSTSSWDWLELCNVKVTHDPRFSRVFPYDDLTGTLLEGLEPRWLIRWNGLPGTVARGVLEGPAMEHATRILWAKEPKTTVMAAVPAASGGGRLLFSQLDLQSRVDRSRRDYDPVAERVLLSLLDRGS